MCNRAATWGSGFHRLVPMALSAQLPPCPTSTRRALVVTAAVDCLDRYVDAWVAAPPERPEDAGPAVLAVLAGASAHPNAEWHASRALTVWQHGFHRGTPNSGLDRGQAAYVTGLGLAGARRPLRGLAEREARALADRWTVGPVTAAEYTLVHGAPGAVLALAGGAEPDQALPLARRLAAVPEWPADMDTGLGHGVAGVAAALRAAYEVSGAAADFAAGLRRACDWLVGRSTVDRQGVPTWPAPGSGWAHGTAGVAWTLWEAGRVLDDPRLRRRATRAMDSYCGELLRVDLPRGAPVTFRDGAAGTLALADAFTRHAGLPSAEDLRDQIEERLADRLTDVRDRSGHHMTLLDGACGVLAVLLTVAGGNRRWLTPYGLR
jgi:hypothetical protein